MRNFILAAPAGLALVLSGCAGEPEVDPIEEVVEEIAEPRTANEIAREVQLDEDGKYNRRCNAAGFRAENSLIGENPEASRTEVRSVGAAATSRCWERQLLLLAMEDYPLEAGEEPITQEQMSSNGDGALDISEFFEEGDEISPSALNVAREAIQTRRDTESAAEGAPAPVAN